MYLKDFCHSGCAGKIRAEMRCNVLEIRLLRLMCLDECLQLTPMLHTLRTTWWWRSETKTKLSKTPRKRSPNHGIGKVRGKRRNLLKLNLEVLTHGLPL